MDIDVDVTIRNYRCFADTPVRFTLKKGLHSFVGVNNSGKSCILRLFYELRNIFAILSNPQSLYSNRTQPPQPYSAAPVVKDTSEIFYDRNQRNIVVAFEWSADVRKELPEAPSRAEIEISRADRTWVFRIYGPDQAELARSGTQFQNPGPDKFYILLSPRNERVDLGPITELFSALTRSLYLGPFRNAVNIGGSGDYYDIQIGQPFITQWRLLKTGYQKQHSEATYRLTDDIQRIFGFDSLDINASDDGQNLQLMIDGKAYKQSEIGSGLIQFILVLANAAIKTPSFILIDEPELNLHPSLQVDFLTTLASYAEHGVLFATHNLGLARAVSNRVYSVRKVGAYGREVRDFTGTPALAEFLGEMGFNAYQDLGYETVLLVEGPHDITCLQQLLRLYGKEHKIVPLHLGGSAMVNSACEPQLAEITRISKRIYALIDSERTQPGEPLGADREGFQVICSKLNIRCQILERRAIENYLPEHAIRAVKKSDKYRALQSYEALKDLDPAWGKAENWRIARLMSSADLKGTDLDTFLTEI